MAVNVSGGPLDFVAAIETSNFGASIRSMEAQLKGLTQTANQQSIAMENVASKASLAIGSYLSVTAASNFLNQIIEVRGEFQKLEAVLTNSLGSNELAKGALGMIADYAAKTPFQLNEIGDAYVKLVNQGFKPTKDELVSLGDLAASTGKSFGQLTEAILDAQTNQFERLKEFGIKASKEGDNVKFTFKGVETTVADTSEAIKEYILGLGQLQGVSGATAAISKTLVGQISNLRDSFDRMLNEIGQGSEGAISGAVAGVSYLIDNYQKVIDAIKVLIITYGTYKTAVIVATSLTNGYTIAQTLQYHALLIAEKAQRLLNLAMKANPYVLVATALAGLISGYVLFGKEASNIKTKAELVADAQGKVADSLSETQAKFQPYLQALQKTNLTENERLDIYKKIQAIDPEILKGIDGRKLKYEQLAVAVAEVTKNLRQQIELEANKTALTESIKQEREIDKRIKNAEKFDEFQKKQRNSGQNGLGSNLIGFTEDASKKNLQKLKDDLKAQQAVTEDLAKTTLDTEAKISDAKNKRVDVQKRTVSVIDAEIKAQKELQEKTSTNSTQYNDFQRKINALEAERKKIVGETKSEIKAQQTEENKLNAILEKRKSILDDIATLHRDAVQSGLTKEASEVDKINEKYDETLKKVDEFNRKYPKQKISTASIEQIGKDRSTEIRNALLRQDTESYKKNLDAQKEIFERYEDAKKQIGVEKANEMFGSQLKGFTSYIDLLKNEQGKLLASSILGGFDVGISEKLKEVNSQIVQAENEASKARQSQALADLNRIIDATNSYNQRRLNLEDKFQKDVVILKKNYTDKELEDRLDNLTFIYNEDLTALQNNLIRQSQLYQDLNRDMIGFTRDQLKERLELLKKYLRDGFILERDGTKTTITPAMKADLEAAIQQAKEFIGSTNEVFGLSVKKLNDIAKYAKLTGSSLQELGQAVSGLNEGLGDTLNTMGSIANIGGNVASSMAGFLSGDIAGGISGAVSAISGVFSLFSAASESRKKAEAELEAYQQKVLDGEINVNLQYRERLRQQVALNKLRIDGINAESSLLKKQQDQNLKDYQKIFALIQNESKITGEHTERSGGFLGIGRKTNVVQDLGSLAGSSFDDLEKLFISGALTEKAKSLFEELQKLKKEGVDIDAALEENKKAAQEIFTGTTASSITDTIVQGFADGKRSVQDFASDTESLIRGALLNALKYKALEGPLSKLYDQFAIDAESNGGLDLTEVESFQKGIANAIQNANEMAKQLEQASGISLKANGSNSNSLSGAIKGMTETQADLLAGQFGGLRLTAIEALNIGKSSLTVLNKIENNTAAAVTVMSGYYKKWDTTGLKIA